MLKELLYPFDANYILSKKKRIKRELLDQRIDYVDKKVAILGGYTTSDIKLILEIFLLNQGIRPEFYESEYNQYYQDALFPSEELINFKPDVVYICTSNRNITTYPILADSVLEVDSLLQAELDKFTVIWESVSEKLSCPIIQNNFEMPLYRLMGNKDASDIHGRVNFLTRLNLKFYEYAQQHSEFYICDINYISADYGLKEWSDPFYYHMYKYALNVNAIPYLSFNVANIIKSIFGKNKKGFVLDMDNTLWGGVIGDDGVEHIALGPEEPEGQVYGEFQRYIRDHKQLGIILNIASKNERENALNGLKHADSELSEDDFICIKANWDSKDKNFSDIAKELNVLPESLVFIDDNPAERMIVASQLTGVCAPEIGSVQDYIRIIDRNGFFETTSISDDDAKRNAMYKENVVRAQSQVTYADYNEYLKSLAMKGIIKAFEPIYMERIAQLTNKSNQFNLTTRRYSLSEIEQAASDKSYITLYGKLLDKFGDNGVVSVVIGHQIEDVCHIDLWIMSCRVLKRNMEFAMMDTLVGECQKRNIKRIKGYYYPTAKNTMVKEFYSLQGFEQVSLDETGNSQWELFLDKEYKLKNQVIEIEL